jgi:hypothetical protein
MIVYVIDSQTIHAKIEEGKKRSKIKVKGKIDTALKHDSHHIWNVILHSSTTKAAVESKFHFFDRNDTFIA